MANKSNQVFDELNLEKTPKIPIRQKLAQDRLIHHGDRLEKLGILHPKFPIILVGGTNGKGSTTHMIGRIFQEAGYKVGINTSPHLIKFNERVRINESPISDSQLDFYLAKINQDFADFPLGYNEYSFLLGLYAFIHQDVDLAVFEIGLGGRFDPANLMAANMSVITNIDLDHTEILGDTLEKIALEKAEIIKPCKPIILGKLSCPLAIHAIQRKATQVDAKLYIAEQEFSFEQFQKIYNLPLPNILPCNAALAIQAALLAKDFLPIPKIHISNALTPAKKSLKTVLINATQDLQVPGRLQEIPWKTRLLLDVCHNPGGCENLKNYLLKNPIQGKNYAIFAVSETKDSRRMIQIMSPVIHHWILPNIQDLQAPEKLIQSFPDFDQNFDQKSQSPLSHSYIHLRNLKDALRFLNSELTSADRLIVFGSFYLGGEFLCELSAASAN